jgi:hypothetical protein
MVESWTTGRIRKRYRIYYAGTFTKDLRNTKNRSRSSALRHIFGPDTYSARRGCKWSRKQQRKTVFHFYNKAFQIKSHFVLPGYFLAVLRHRIRTCIMQHSGKFAWPLSPCKTKMYYIFRVFVALVIQHAMRMRRIILPSVACLAVPYFSTLSHDFRGKSHWT